jgi:hypothetical protein
MKKEGYNTAVKIDDGVINVNLTVVIFLDDKVTIVYCPALDLAGYGEDEARQSFQTVIEEYFDYTVSRGTLFADLKLHGWETTQQTIRQPEISDLLTTNKHFADIFNKYDFRKTAFNITVPIEHHHVV